MKVQELHLPPDGKLRALTVREPWATLIVMSFKPIENRVLPFPKALGLPCTIAIHASTNGDSIGDDCTLAAQDEAIASAFENPKFQLHKMGAEWFYGGTIVGLVTVTANVCIAEYCDGSDASESKLIELIDDAHPWPAGPQSPDARRSEWANGPECLILNNPIRFRTGVVCRGQLGFWTVPDDKLALVHESMKDVLANPNDLPNAPVGGVPKFLGRRPK